MDGSAHPSDASARRAARLAVAQALRGSGLDWAALSACPPWLAAAPAAREQLCAHAGAWWLAASLRACIDGRRLARVYDLLGEARLNALRASPDIARAQALNQAPQPLLPPDDDMPQHLMACGRALLAWSLPALPRPAVLQHLGWRIDERHYDAFAAHAAWAAHALQAVLSDAPPAQPEQAAEPPDEVADARVEEYEIDS
ncbi:hypothetical protein [Ottowia testudinis]|uniref:Uncharacterized protein n=1 Tax=Ottowia testudinis TaxID=2816950 RepID=A0A975CFI9_9BURK|nr:hypothetical protein [Ottowia testudinis]QTD45503.1 hypothetical protein J1M35_00810 [Ottowia testudinis]